jgi:co-chaperonin GroES (HSP10)
MIRVAHANKLLVKQLNQNTNLGNGLQISNETQNRKDIVVGIIVDCMEENKIGKKIFFPLYSALPLSYEGENYLVIDTDDVLVIEVNDRKDN